MFLSTILIFYTYLSTIQEAYVLYQFSGSRLANNAADKRNPQRPKFIM